MLKQTIALLALTTSIGLPATLTLAPQQAQASCAAATSLSGVWYGNDGGTYSVRESGKYVTWTGRSRDNGRTWTHIFQGTRNGDIVTGTWIDQPNGRIRSKGNLSVKVKISPYKTISGFTRIEATGGFGGSKWHQSCNDVEYQGV